MVKTHQLGVGAEPATGRVYGGEIVRQQAAALAELGRVGDEQPDLGAQGGPVRLRRGILTPRRTPS